MDSDLNTCFEPYRTFSPAVPVYAVSAPGRPSIHRFYDSSPISPSGRYLVVTEFDYEDRLPAAGDEASVVVYDLHAGQETYRSRTCAWDTQLGAQAQWGAQDSELFFNRMSPQDWRPHGVCVDIFSGTERRLGGAVYAVSPDGRKALSPCLVRIWLVQPGYGVIVPDALRIPPKGAEASDGLFLTDTVTGESTLLVSMAQIYATFPKEFAGLDLDDGGFYGFHAKWSPNQKRIMFILRWRDRAMRKGQSKNWIVTMDADGRNLRLALDASRWVGGHHPNWCPDSDHIVMNLAFRNPKVPFPKLMRLAERVARKLKMSFHSNAYALRLARFRYDGTGLEVLAPSHFGSGHPTYSEALDAVLTDAYPTEIVAAGDGTVPLRLISVSQDASRELVRMACAPKFAGSRQEWRVDPHPAWDRTGRRISFNGYANGHRQVFIADLGRLFPAAEA